MSNEMKIDAALAELEAGKFSFRMVDAIKNHVSKLESELEVIRSLHATAIRELKLQEYANWRLEGELRAQNAKIYALVRANMLTEKAYREMMPLAIMLGAYFEASLKVARAALETAVADLKSGKFQSQLVEATSKLYGLLKANLPTEKTLREMQPYVVKIRAYSETTLKVASVVLEKVAADLKSGKFQSQFLYQTSKLHEWLNANAPTKKIRREIQPYAIAAGHYFQVLKKHVASGMVRATAYLFKSS